jgi:hypothetical protein
MCQYWRGWAPLHAGEWVEQTKVLDETAHAVERNGHGRLTLLFRLLRASLYDQAGDFETAQNLRPNRFSKRVRPTTALAS